MLVFIDESGDPGLKFEEGSSAVFVIALIIFKENSDATTADADISAFRALRGISRKAEFKFNKMDHRRRREFLERATKYSFRYFGIVIDKRGLQGDEFKQKDSFYNYACGLVCANAKAHLMDATVTIDGSGDREFRRELGTYLKNQTNSETSSRIKKVKIGNSHSNNLIQLADMVSGAIYRSHKKGKEDQSYRAIIKAKEIQVEVWPK